MRSKSHLSNAIVPSEEYYYFVVDREIYIKYGSVAYKYSQYIVFKSRTIANYESVFKACSHRAKWKGKKNYLMFVAYSLIFSDCFLIFLAFASSFALCE